MQKILLLLFIVKTAVAAESECGVVPMIQWAGADSLREEQLSNPVSLVVIQHTVTQECTTDDECEKRVKSIQKYHIDYLKFTDIALSFVIGGNGKVYEGAGWERVGAHTLGYNKKSIGVSFIGQFQDKLPSPEALKAVHDLLACGVETKHLTKDYHLVGHQQLSVTESPGETLQNHIQTWPHWEKDAKSV